MTAAGRTLLALWVALALAAGAIAGAQVAQAAPAKAKVRCHWVKATKKRKRHRVCVKVKAKRPTPAAKAPAAPSAATPAPTITVPAPGPAANDPAPAPATTPPAIDPAPAAPAAARLQATTREFSIVLSRPSVPAGALTLELVNRGEDAHDLHVRPAAGGADLLAIARTDVFGTVADADGTLPAGTYTLYCALPGHEALGMHATLTVQ